MTLLRWGHRLSWLALMTSILWMMVLPGYPGSGLVFAAAFHYVLVYALGVGLARLYGYRRRPVALAPEPVRIRRMVLEEISPYNERTGHAR
jgi:hypothetical protein